MVFIFIIKLKNNKYFVGFTNKCDFCLEDFNPQLYKWTIKHNPIKLKELTPHCNHYHINKFTQHYMFKYGIHNVRGGSYLSIKLDPPVKSFLENLKKKISKNKTSTLPNSICNTQAEPNIYEDLSKLKDNSKSTDLYDDPPPCYSFKSKSISSKSKQPKPKPKQPRYHGPIDNSSHYSTNKNKVYKVTTNYKFPASSKKTSYEQTAYINIMNQSELNRGVLRQGGCVTNLNQSVVLLNNSILSSRDYLKINIQKNC